MNQREYVSLDMSDLFDRRDMKSIRNFYLSGRDFGARLLEGLKSFTFNGFFISICLGGSGRLRISGRNYDIGAGSLMIFSPNQLIEILSADPGLDWKSIIVSLDVILEFPSPVDIDVMTSALRNPVLHIGEASAMHLLEYYTFIEKRYSETLPCATSLTRTLTWPSRSRRSLPTISSS